MDKTEGLKIIDCDAHFTEPADVWSSRAPASMRDRIPVQETVDGRTAWYLNGQPWASTGGNTIETGGNKVLGQHVVQPFERVDNSAWAVKERLELMDDMGIWAQILYPNGVGFSSNHIFAIEDLEQRAEILKMYNDFFVEVQHEGHGRLFPQCLLPIWDMDFTVAEMTRLIDQGVTGFTLSDKPELLGLPELPDAYFEPMWDVFNETRAVANFHIGAGNRREDIEELRNARYRKPGDPVQKPGTNGGVVPPAWSSFGHQRRLAVLSTQMYMSNVRIIVNLCMSNLFDRYPNLKIVSAESGIGWVPFILESMEYQYDEMVTEDDEVRFAQRRPSEYFHDHLYVMFWFEEVGAARLIDKIGSGNVLVETDVPHPTCLYPNPREHFGRVLADIDADTVRKVLQDNGAALYGIEVGG